MNKSYVIQWKSLVNGRSGKGTKLFEWEEAQLLANELNQGYPDIEHEVVEGNGAPEPTPDAPKTEPVEQPEVEYEPQVAHGSVLAFSFK